MTGHPRITRLQLADFRNYAALDLHVDARHVVLHGANGAGKTNILEALSFLSPGRGLRRVAYEDITRQEGAGGWALATELDGADGFKVALGVGLEAGSASRTIRIDHEPARRAESLLDHLDVLWLIPAMDGLFTGPTGDRRRFLDRLTLSMVSDHGRAVAGFEKAMRSRNRLLDEPRPDPVWLDGLEAEMARLAGRIVAARTRLVRELEGPIEALRARESPFPWARLALDVVEGMTLDGDDPDWSAAYAAMLADNRRMDARAGRTLRGPHRTDLRVEHGPKAMAAAKASTGEQKALLIGLILAQASLIAERNGRAPVLLLDEIAAHLDGARRAALFDILDALGGQSWMTGTDSALFEALGTRAERFRVEDGRVTRQPG